MIKFSTTYFDCYFFKAVIQTLKDIGHTANRLKPLGPGSATTGIARTPSGMLEAIADFRRTGNSSGY